MAVSLSHVPVKSSFVESIGHDGTTIEFKLSNGKVYTCHDCTPEEHARIVGAASIGREFNAMRGRLSLVSNETE
jgi:hypothetical protein